MAEKRKAPDAADAARKRKAPTIDLTATDVTPEPATAEPPPSAGEAVNAAAAEPAAPPIADTPPQPGEPPRTDAGPQASPGAEAVAANRAGAPFGAMLAAGVAGGIIVAAALGGLWYAGVVPSNTPAAPDTQTPQQIAKLQQEVAALQNRPAPTSTVDPKTVDALTQRVAQAETALKNLPASGGADPQIGQRLASVESAVKSGDTAISTLNKRIDDIAANATQARQEADAAGKAVTQLQSHVKDLARNQSGTVTPAQIDGLLQRLASLEQSEKAARESVARSTAAASATRLALAAQALRNVVVSGAPYRRELAQAKTLGAQASRLAPLAPFAATGVPTAESLARDLHGLLPQIRKIAAPQAQTSGSFLDRLQANAGRLVHISPVSAPAGNDPTDVLARLEAATAHNDIAAAVADIAKLPEAAQAPAKDWLARVKARAAALAASTDIAETATRALAPGAQ